METFFAEHLGGRTSAAPVDFAYTVIVDDFWGDVFVPDTNIPTNIDGRQGIAMRRLIIQPHHPGDYIVILDEFTDGMSRVNTAIYVGGQLAAVHMNMHPGDSFSFTINPEEVGAEMLVVMSTNSASSGTARISAIVAE